MIANVHASQAHTLPMVVIRLDYEDVGKVMWREPPYRPVLWFIW